MKIFEETVEEATNRRSEGTLFVWLFFAFIGIIAIVTPRRVEGSEFLGTCPEIEGGLVVGFGVALSAGTPSVTNHHWTPRTTNSVQAFL